MEISTRQLLAPRPPVPIVPVPEVGPKCIEFLRDQSEIYGFVIAGMALLQRARTIGQARNAFIEVRDSISILKAQQTERPDGGWVTAAVAEECRRLEKVNARHDARKAAKANSAIADVNTH